MKLAPVALALVLVVLGSLVVVRLGAPPSEVELAGYATTLVGRTPGQRHNARLAARALDGVIIAPGGAFSFNRTVRSWTMDRGYVKAPVSYDGELVRAFGGGVCQTSTTLYNAALLAGLTIMERHSHVFAPTYVAPGRDAAVAQYDIDLRLGNPHPWPLRLQARALGDRLEVRVLGRERPPTAVEITADVLSATVPARMVQRIDRPEGASGRTYLRTPGATGYRVVTYRTFSVDGRVIRRELLSDDSYPVMNRVVALMQTRMP